MKTPISPGFLALALASGLALEPSARAGSVARLYYDGISTASSVTSVRTSVATLTNSSRFPDFPTFREQLDDFTTLPGTPLRAGLQGKDNSGADYGSYIRGYLEAPATGVYLFNIASDDSSALFLSTDHTEARKRQVAFETESGAPLFGGPRQDQRLSQGISLVRGQKYYFEILHKQGGGGSYIQVGWQRPDGVQEIIPALHLSQFPVDPFLGTGAPDQAPILNTRGLNGGNLPAAVTVAEGDELLLQLDVIAAQPTTYTWRQNGTNIPGENLSFFRLPRTPASLNGRRIQASVVNASGNLDTATTTVTVTPDVTPPSVLAVETGGNPNLLRVTFSEPVERTGAVSAANYQIRVSGGAVLPVQSVTLLPDDKTVELAGVFGFRAGVDYLVTVQGIRDQAVTPNTLSPGPTSVPFVFSAPTGTTYSFNAGRPSGFSFFGNADVVASGSHDGSGYLRLTDATRNQNGAVVLTERRDVDQVRIRFKTRLSDGASTSGVDDPGDGFSVNVAADLPLGTLGQPEEGFTPDVPGNRLSFAFDTHADSSDDLPSIRVLLNNQVVTNIVTGTNGLSFRGIPSLNSVDGHWADVDIDIRRNGLLTLRWDGVTVIDQLPTAFEVVNSAQIGFAARTRTWYQTHWIDDLNVNYGEGDIGDVAISPDSILGGTFLEGSQVRLSVLPTGAGPFQYQWFRSGLSIPNETGRILEFPAVAGAGASYSVRVTNPFSEIASTPQAVVIQPDVAPASVVSVVGVAGGVNQVRLTFNEPLDPDSASSLATFSSPLFRISEAILQGDGRTVLLRTTPLRVGIRYPLNIAGLRDRSAQANVLNGAFDFVATLTYRDEVLADNPVRYYRFEETSGTVAFTQTTSGDQLNTNGVYQNFPGLGVPTLVPSATGEYAAHFTRANTNYVAVPNGGDLNDFRGPWAKKSYEFWFKADSVPGVAPAGANAADTQFYTTAGLWEEGGNLRSIAVYLWRNPARLNPAEAELTFHSYNDTPDGPGAPYGLRQYPAVYVTATIRTNTTYHVVAVQDGSTDSRDGELRLYVNGELVSRTNGVGQIYNHNGDVQIARGNSRSHLNISANYGSLDGTLDEVSTYNVALTPDRIRAHYRAGTGESLSTVAPETRVASVDAGGHPSRLAVVFNQPVGPATATNLANYVLRAAGGTILPVQSARLLDDLVTVQLSGSFGFAQGLSYQLSVSGVADILAPANVVAPVTVPFTFNTLGPVGIAPGSGLGDSQVVENGTIRFSVTATGQPPFHYQWLRDNAEIPGATGPALEFTVPIDASGLYAVRVRNEFSETTSPAARLTVLRDTLAPALVSVRAFAGSLNQVRLEFSEPLQSSIATNLATYGLTPVGGAGATLLGATLSPDGRTVTLQTTPQSNGQVHRVTVAGVADRAATPNRLSTAATVTTGVGYREEILSEGAVRYWTFDETTGTEFHTLASRFDTARENLVGTIVNGPQLGVPGLVANLPSSTAFRFRDTSPSNHVFLPNGRDINAILGPWAKRTHLLSFRADHLPRVTITTNIVDNQFVVTTNIAAPALYAHDRIALYLFGSQESEDPTEAQLVFRAHNTTSEGPGTPWGGTTLATSKHVIATIRRGQTYHVAAVLDGSPTAFTGELKLYLDGQLVGAVGGIGQIYKHPNTTPTIGIGSFRTHTGESQSVDFTASNFNARFDGVIDEFSLVPKALSAGRIADLFAISRTAPAGPAVIETPSAFTGIRVENGTVTVRWEGPARLLRSDRLDRDYAPVDGA
jgi:Concanavalin A-like lectin/glucanases superfamily/PA14 domain